MTRGLARLLILFAVLDASPPAVAQGPVSFRRDIAPILRDHCLGCHGPRRAEGGYRVDTYARALKEGDSAAPGFAAKDHEGSESFRRIVSDDPEERMPKDGKPLAAEKIALLRRWIAEGARYDAADPNAPLIAIMPPPLHPQPPEKYRRPLPVTAVAFSRDGESLLVSGYHEVTEWRVSDGKLLRRIGNVPQRVYALTLSPDGKRLAVAGGQPGRLGEVRQFDPASGKLVRVLAPAADAALAVAYRPDGKQLAVAAADNSLRIYDAQTGKLVKALASHADWVTAVAYSRDGRLLASASRDKSAKVYDAAGFSLRANYPGGDKPLYAVAFDREGKHLLVAGAARRVRFLRTSDAKQVADVAVGDDVYCLTPAAAGRVLAGVADGSVRVLDASSSKQLRRLDGHQDWILSAAFHGGRKLIAAGAFDGRVRIYHAETGKLVSQFLAAPGLARSKEE